MDGHGPSINPARRCGPAAPARGEGGGWRRRRRRSGTPGEGPGSGAREASARSGVGPGPDRRSGSREVPGGAAGSGWALSFMGDSLGSCVHLDWGGAKGENLRGALLGTDRQALGERGLLRGKDGILAPHLPTRPGTRWYFAGQFQRHQIEPPGHGCDRNQESWVFPGGRPARRVRHPARPWGWGGSPLPPIPLRRPSGQFPSGSPPS